MIIEKCTICGNSLCGIGKDRGSPCHPIKVAKNHKNNIEQSALLQYCESAQRGDPHLKEQQKEHSMGDIQFTKVTTEDLEFLKRKNAHTQVSKYDSVCAAMSDLEIGGESLVIEIEEGTTYKKMAQAIATRCRVHEVYAPEGSKFRMLPLKDGNLAIVVVKAKEAPVEEAPVEEAPVEEAPVEEEKAESTKKTPPKKKSTAKK